MHKKTELTDDNKSTLTHGAVHCHRKPKQKTASANSELRLVLLEAHRIADPIKGRFSVPWESSSLIFICSKL